MVFSFSLFRFGVRGYSRRLKPLLGMALGLLLVQGCAMLHRPADIVAPAPTKPQPAQPTAKKSPAVQLNLPQTGVASWYGAAHDGKPTASGEKFDQTRFTAAHRSLPFGTKVKVTNLGSGKTVVVQINDRGPFVEHRIIDLSHAAAKALEMTESGTARVRLELSSGP